MGLMQWVFIILLLLLIAAGIWMLTRKPTSGKDRSDGSHDGATQDGLGNDDVASQAAGGEHVSAGDAGVSGGPDLYDQEADARSGDDVRAHDDVRADDEIRPEEIWDGQEGGHHETAGQDTATGADVPIVEDEPVVPADADSEPVGAPEDQDDLGDHHERAEHHDLDDHVLLGDHIVQDGDRDQMSYGDPQAEDFASETVYAPAPVQETPGPPAAVDGDLRDPDQGSPGAASQSGDEATYAEHAADHRAGTENAGPQGLDEQWPDRDPEQGSPGASPMVANTDAHPSEGAVRDEDSLDGRSADEVIGGQEGHAADPFVDGPERRDEAPESLGHAGAASERLGRNEGDSESLDRRGPDQGRPEPDSHVGDNATDDIPVGDMEHEHDDVPADAEAAGFVGSTGATALTKDHADEADEADVTDDHGVTDVEEPEAAHLDSDEGEAAHLDGDEDRGLDASEPAVDEPSSADEAEPQVAMVDVDAFPAEPAAQEDTAVDEATVESDPQVESDRHDAEGEDAERPAAVTSADSEPAPGRGHDDDAGEQSAPAEERLDSADPDQPQAVMVDVDDHSTEAAPERDSLSDGEDHEFEAERPEPGPGQEPEQHETEQHETQQHESQRDEVETEPEQHEPEMVSQPQREEVETEPEHDAPEHAVVDSPYGPGSVFADEDGTVPAGYDIKGNAGSMLFHTPESPSYESSVPEVYFESEEAARAAGFAHWDRKRR